MLRHKISRANRQPAADRQPIICVADTLLLPYTSRSRNTPDGWGRQCCYCFLTFLSFLLRNFKKIQAFRMKHHYESKKGELWKLNQGEIFFTCPATCVWRTQLLLAARKFHQSMETPTGLM